MPPTRSGGENLVVAADGVKLVANDAEDVLTVHTDHLGAPQKMTDASRAVVWDAAFTPFGDEDSIVGAGVNHWRFPGQYAELETGLSYNWMRTYDPSLGRFLQSDPIGLAGGLNTYAYVGGNPLSYVDPSGLTMGSWCLPGFEFNDPLCSSSTGEPMGGGGGGKASGGTKAGKAAAAKAEGQMCPIPAAKMESPGKRALREMAESDKRKGISEADMQAYKELNKELGPEGFPQKKVRGPEEHSSGGPHSQQPHGHVGPVDHIPVNKLGVLNDVAAERVISGMCRPRPQNQSRLRDSVAFRS